MANTDMLVVIDLHFVESRQVFSIWTVAAYSAKYSALVVYKIVELVHVMVKGRKSGFLS